MAAGRKDAALYPAAHALFRKALPRAKHTVAGLKRERAMAATFSSTSPGHILRLAGQDLLQQKGALDEKERAAIYEDGERAGYEYKEDEVHRLMREVSERQTKEVEEKQRAFGENVEAYKRWVRQEWAPLQVM